MMWWLLGANPSESESARPGYSSCRPRINKLPNCITVDFVSFFGFSPRCRLLVQLETYWQLPASENLSSLASYEQDIGRTVLSFCRPLSGSGLHPINIEGDTTVVYAFGDTNEFVGHPASNAFRKVSNLQGQA